MKRIHGYCAPQALTYVSGLPESQVLDMCKWHGFVDNGQGMDDDQWMETAKDLGIRKRAVRFSNGNVGAFLKAHPRGLYLVTTHNHIFAVLNGGMVTHPIAKTTSKRCKVHGAWRILAPK